MSSYLLALVISDLECSYIEAPNMGKTGNVTIYVCGRSEAIKAGQFDFALSVVIKIIKFYENLFGAKYPLSSCGNYSEQLKNFRINF
jgi:aminopeptidase N